MADQQIDYASLAQQFGGSLSNGEVKAEASPNRPAKEVDYGALAKQFGGSLSDAPAPPKQLDYSALMKQFGGTLTDAPAEPESIPGMRGLPRPGPVKPPLVSITEQAQSPTTAVIHAQQEEHGTQAAAEKRMTESMARFGSNRGVPGQPDLAEIGQVFIPPAAEVVAGAAAGVESAAGRQALKAVNLALNGYFAYTTGKGAVQQSGEAYKSYQAGDYLGAVRNLGTAGLEGALAWMNTKAARGQFQGIADIAKAKAVLQEQLNTKYAAEKMGDTGAPRIEGEVTPQPAQGVTPEPPAPAAGFSPVEEAPTETGEAPLPATVKKGQAFETPAGKVRVVSNASGQVVYQTTTPEGKKLAPAVLPADQFQAMVKQPEPPAGFTPVAEPAATAEPGARPLPSWAAESIDRDFETAKRLGVVDDIERLSAEGLVAKEVAARLSLPGDAFDKSGLVRAVRNKLGIPSQMDAADFSKWQQEYKDRTAKPEEKQHNFASTQANLPAPVAEKIADAAALIPPDKLADKGIETEHHVTVKYGLHGEDPAAVAEVLKDEPPIEVTLGKASVFEGKDGKPDVLKVDVDSPSLHELNAKIADALPHTDTFPDYHPHVTIAYLKPGEGAAYEGKAIEGVTGEKITLPSVTFSDKSGKATEIPLALPPGKETASLPPAGKGTPTPHEYLRDWKGGTPPVETKALPAPAPVSNDTPERPPAPVPTESPEPPPPTEVKPSGEVKAPIHDPAALGNYLDTLKTKDHTYAKYYVDKTLGYPVAQGMYAAAVRNLPDEVKSKLFALATAQKQFLETPAAPTAEAAPAAAGMAEAVYQKISRGESLGNVTELNKLAEEHFGASRTSGEWTPKDAFDAMEAGVNKYLIERGKALMEMPYEQAMQELRSLMNKITSQGVRTEEQIKNQQFSTPPTESFTVAKVANIKPTDVTLEPSAGNGGLAVWPKAIGAKVYVNEISERRQKMLEAAGFGPSTFHDGEIIHSLLDPAIKPTVILMNPPFSAGTVKANEAKNKNVYGFNHVDSALQRLQPNGRLVAILGGGRADDTNGGASLNTGPSGKWFDRIAQKYNVRANIRIHGKEYQKYGTNFATRIIVIDKAGTTPSQNTAGQEKNWSSVVQGNVNTLEEAYNLLRNVSADRPETSVSAGPADQGSTGIGEPGTRVASGEVASSSGDGRVLQGERGTLQAGEPTDRLEGPVGSPGDHEPGTGGEPVGLRQSGDELTGHPGPGTVEGPESGGPNADIERPLSGAEAVGLSPETVADDEPHKSDEEDQSAYVTYKPTLKGSAHPADIVETKTMATVPMPKITYKLHLPAELISQGKMSAVQLEAVAIAGQQNAIVLPDGSRATALIGDGTGVGKGRISAGILLDNYRQGRKRLVWVSEKWPLMQDAIRDLDGIGAKDLMRGITKQEGKYVFGANPGVVGLDKYKATAKVQHDGVLFTTYPLIRSKDTKGNRRVSQLEDYLRGDDDGEGAYILFDEAHNLKNAVAAQGGQVSQIGTAVRELMQRLPKLRSASLSATAATDVVNLGYLDRLGLWGPGTPFPNGFREFQSQVAPGGMAAMELIARELKAQGKYVSRTLSYKGVTYQEAEHVLTPEQKELYRTAGKAWNTVLANAGSTIQNTTNGGGRQMGDFMSQFYGAQQRFFNLLITTLKIPTAVEIANKALADGKSVVISLVNTNEAAQNREKAKARDLEDTDEPPDFDFGPKESLINLIREHYPVQQYRDDVDSGGNPVKTPVYRKDESGREIPVTNPEAVAARDELIAEINRDLNMPENPLDILVQSLGGDRKVAELTGRKERYDRSLQKFVPRGDPNVARKEINEVEARNFQNGRKRVAILSGAAGTGISLHAGNDVPNKQVRVHITLQVGWSADKQMQMFGRSHRSNQAHPPEYVMLTSDLGGEKRFVSTIARRLGSLGALTKGQKNAASGTDLMEKVNFETEQGKQATNSFYGALLRDQPIPGTGLTGMQILQDLHVLKFRDGGMTVPPEDRQNVTRLLNRLLALDPDIQNAVYNYFYDTFQAAVQDAIDRGNLDTGVKTLPGDEFSVKESRAISKDPQTGAETYYYPVDAKVRTNRVSPDEMAKRMREHRADNPRLLRNDKGHLLMAIDARPIVHADGSIEPASFVAYPGKGNWQKVPNTAFSRSRLQEVGEWAEAEAQKAEQSLESSTRDLEWRKEDVDRAKARGIELDPDDYRLRGLARAETEVANEQKALDQAKAIAKNPKKWATAAWKEQYTAAPSHITAEHHMIGGAVMKFWNPIKDATFVRNSIFTAADTKTGKRVVGIDIPAERINELLARITGGASTVNAEQLSADVLKNNLNYSLEGGIEVRRGRVGRDNVIQIIPGNGDQANNLKRMGVLCERGVTPVYYIPNTTTGPNEGRGRAILDRVLNEYPVKPEEENGAQGNLAQEQQGRNGGPRDDQGTAAGRGPEGVDVARNQRTIAEDEGGRKIGEGDRSVKGFLSEETGTSTVAQAVRDLTPQVKAKLSRVGAKMKAGQDEILRLLAPAAREGAQPAALSVRTRAAEMARANAQAERALMEARDALNELSPAARWDFYDRAEEGTPEPNPELRAIGSVFRKLLDTSRQDVQNLGTGKLESFIENYLPHIYKDPKKAEQTFGAYYGKAPLEGKKAFLKRRKYETLRDAMAAGLEPITDNPVDQVILKVREMQKYVMAHKVLNDLREAGILKYVKAGDRPPEGYQRIDDKIATVFGPRQGGVSLPEGTNVNLPEGARFAKKNATEIGPDDVTVHGMRIMGQYYAPEAAATVVNNYLSPGLREKSGLFRAYLSAANAMNQFNLGFSAFHLGFTTVDAATSKLALGIYQAAHGHPLQGLVSAIKTPLAPFTGIIQGDKMLKEYFEPGTQGDRIATLVNAMTIAGGRAQMDSFYQTNMISKMMDNFRHVREGLAAKRPGYAGVQAGAGILRAPFALAEKASKPILEWIVPRQKMAIFADLAQFELQRLGEGKLADEDVQAALARAWDSVDNRMGQLVYDNLFWNKTFKDLLMGSVRSVGWNTGTIREVGGGLADISDIRKEGVSTRLSYVIALPFLAGMLGAVIMYLYTGKGPQELKDYYFPLTGRKDKSGQPERVAIPSYMKDIVHTSMDPVGVARGKMHPLLNLIAEMLENEDWQHHRIRNPHDSFLRQIEEEAQHILLAFEPIAVKQAEQEKQRGHSFGQRIPPFFGLGPAPSIINRNPRKEPKYVTPFHRQATR